MMACLMADGEHHVASDRINQRPKWPSHNSRDNQPAGSNEHRQRDHKQRDCRPREQRNRLARIRDRPDAVGSRTHQQRSLEESTSAVKRCSQRVARPDHRNSLQARRLLNQPKTTLGQMSQADPHHRLPAAEWPPRFQTQ